MTFKSYLAGACAAAAALAAGSSALAQAAAPAATPAAPAIPQGPAIPGVCVVDVQNVIGASAVGRSVSTRLVQIQNQVKAELQGEDTTLTNDIKAFEAQRASLDQNAQVQRAADLQKRQIALQTKAEQRQQELQATLQKAQGRVFQEMQGPMLQAYQQKGCSLLLQRDGVILSNNAMDISQPVLAALNAKITQFTFDRERLDGPAPAAAAGAPPIIQTPAPARPAAAPARR